MQGDGLHTGSRYAYSIQQGTLLRVRRGIYVDPDAWLSAARWTRYDIALAATGLASAEPLFCREAALRLHGLPLPYTPTAVTARTAGPSQAGTHKPPPMTGPLTRAQFSRQFHQRSPSAEAFSARALENIPTKFMEPALPPDVSRPQLRHRIRNQLFQSPRVELDAGVLHDVVQGPDTYLTEPLGLALVDTAARMAFADAVVVLDAARALQTPDVAPWIGYLSSQRMRANWEQAWDFSDARSESPAESKSRALIHSLGFAAPSLQASISTDAGTYRCDFCWEEDRVIGEFDGRIKYYDRQLLNGQDPHDVVYAEKLREDALRRAGWMVVRWGWRELQNPKLLAQRLVRAGVSRRAADRISLRFSDDIA